MGSRRSKICQAAKSLLGFCLGDSPASPAPLIPAVPAPAATTAPPNSGAQAQVDGGDGILLHDVAPQNTSTSTNNTDASDRPRPVSLPAAAPSDSQPKKARVSCRPSSRSQDFLGPPPSPPPDGPLPPIPEYARQRNPQQATSSSTTNSLRGINNSQQGRNSKQATTLEPINSSEQLPSKSHLSDTSQHSDSSGESIDSAQLDELLQISNSQQTDVTQNNSGTQIICNFVQLEAPRNLPDMESVILHPLPVICIGDYVTRHDLREQPGPIVGALFGQQNGREVTIEFAYEVQTLVDGDQVTLEPSWFETRVEQSKS